MNVVVIDGQGGRMGQLLVEKICALNAPQITLTAIGTNAIDVVRSHPDAFRVTALAALHAGEACAARARELGARAYVGPDAAVRAVEENEADGIEVTIDRSARRSCK